MMYMYSIKDSIYISFSVGFQFYYMVSETDPSSCLAHPKPWPPCRQTPIPLLHPPPPLLPPKPSMWLVLKHMFLLSSTSSHLTTQSGELSSSSLWQIQPYRSHQRHKFPPWRQWMVAARLYHAFLALCLHFHGDTWYRHARRHHRLHCLDRYWKLVPW